MKPKVKREIVSFAIINFGHSNRHACQLIGLNRSTRYYKVKNLHKDDVIRTRMHELVNENIKWGCPMIHHVLKREGLVVNRKRTERIYYRDEKLSIRRRPRRRKAHHNRIEVPEATRPNERWAMDFVHDSLWNGRKLRFLNIVDVFTKEALRIEVDHSLTGYRVVESLNRIINERDCPEYITVDNGPEFRSKALDKWAYDHQVKLDFIRPGKPVDNCYVESFNSRFREECLNANYFDTLTEARFITDEWRKKYNEFRPHRTLNGLTPLEFLNKISSLNLYSKLVQ